MTGGWIIDPGTPPLEALLLAAAAALLVAAADRRPLKVARPDGVSLTNAPLFLTALLFPPVSAMLVAGAGMAMSRLTPTRTRSPGTSVAVAAAGLPVALAAFVYRVLATPSDAWLLEPRAAAYAAFSAMVLIAARMALLALASGKENILSSGGSMLAVIPAVGVFGLGYLAAASAQQAWWSVGLLLPPLVMADVLASRVVRAGSEDVQRARDLQQRLAWLRADRAQPLGSAPGDSTRKLARGLAHELSTPLFAIQGRAESLLTHPEQHLATPAARQSLSEIEQMAARVSNAVRDLEMRVSNGDVLPPVSRSQVSNGRPRPVDARRRR